MVYSSEFSELINEGNLKNVLHKIFPHENILRHVRKNANIKNLVTGYYLELDFWIPRLNLAFEFQDPYHYITYWGSQLPLSLIYERDSAKQVHAQLRGFTLMTVPYWWRGSKESLAASIRFVRPDILLPTINLSNPFPMNPPAGQLVAPGVPGVGELMLASYPLSLQFNATVAANPWWLGEKYDGMRACWQPAMRHLYTRSGVRVPLLKSISRLFGKSAYLDGEIWFGRGNFEETQLFVRLTNLDDINWPFFRFVTFDTPARDKRKLRFERRFKFLLKSIKRSHPFIKVASRVMCRDPYILEEMARLILNDEGEGVILRKPGSRYHSGRSTSLLKLKAVRGDTEALVVAEDENGTCIIQLPDPEASTVRAVKEIQLPLKKGDIVSIKFDNYSRNALPVNPKIFRVRLDLEWDEVKRSYHENVSQSQKFNANTSKVFKRDSPAGNFGYWNSKENIRKFLEGYARSRQLDPLDPNTWYSIKQTDIATYKRTGSALANYKGSIVKAAVDLFPELELDITKFIYMPKNYWKNLENRRRFFIKYANQRGFDPLKPENWYSISLDSILDVKGGYSLMQYYQGSPTSAVLHAFPELGLDTSNFVNMPKFDYWRVKKNRRNFLDDYARTNGFDPLVPDNWYKVGAEHLYSHRQGLTFRNYYRRDLRKALFELYPDIGLDGAKFDNLKKSFWLDTSNRRQVFESYAAHKQFDPLLPEKWSTIDPTDFMIWKNATRLLSRYKFSLIEALVHCFPEVDFTRTSFVSFPLALSNFSSSMHRREILLQFAKTKGFDPLFAQNWYNVSKSDIQELQAAHPKFQLSARFIATVKNVLPNINFDDSQKITKSSNYWLDMKNRRQFFVELAAKKGFSPLVVDNWYNITLDDILAEKGGVTVMGYYRSNRTAALKHLFPELEFDDTKFANMWKKYFAVPGNRRNIFDKFAKSRSFDPLVAENWYSITSEDVLSFEGSASVLTFYKGSFVSALEHLYPEIGLEVAKFSFFRPNALREWDQQKRRNFFEKFARKQGFDPLVLANWHPTIIDSLQGIPGLSWVTAPYKSQPLLALTKLFPEFETPSAEIEIDRLRTSLGKCFVWCCWSLFAWEMRKRGKQVPLFLLLLYILMLFFGSVSSSEQSYAREKRDVQYITDCKNFKGVTNIDYIFNVDISSPESPCLLFENAVNITVTGNSHSISTTGVNIGIQVDSSSNITISNLILTSSSITITQSQVITISQCSFIGTTSGVHATGTDTAISVLNNTFTNSGIFANNITSGNVDSNTITNGGNITIFLTNTQLVSVTNNNVINTNGPSGIFVSVTYVGEIVNNVVQGGSVGIGITLEIAQNTSGTSTVSDNLVSDINTGCSGNSNGPVGIVLENPFKLPPIIMENNRVQNYVSPCWSGFTGISTIGFAIVRMNNNSVANISILVPSGIYNYPIGYYGYLITRMSGALTNTSVTDFHLGPPDGSQADVTLVAISLDENEPNFILDTFTAANLSIATTKSCSGCNNTKGKDIYGIMAYEDLTARNIHMSDLTAGGGGLITGASKTVTSSGGNVFGIFVNWANKLISVDNAYFYNLIAGDAGTISGAATYNCNGGQATYFTHNITVNTPFGIQYFSDMEAMYMVNGINCLDASTTVQAPTSATVTFNRTSYSLVWDAPPPPDVTPSNYHAQRKRGEEIITGYTVESFENGNWTVIYTTPNLSYTNSSLSQNTTHWIRVGAIAAGYSTTYAYFVITTRPNSAPAPPPAPTYKEFTKTTISLIWTSGDDGGFPITNYTLQMSNSSNPGVWVNVFNGSNESYVLTGLQEGQGYNFRLAASNQLGESGFSVSTLITTATTICGDGTCDTSKGETCSTCYLDCGSCGYQQCPGTPVCNGGTCVNGVCNCPSSKSGPACEYDNSPINVATNNTSPTSVISIANTGDSKVTDDTQFTVEFREIAEINPNNQVITSFDLTQLAFFAETNVTDAYKVIVYNGTLPNNAVVIFYLYLVYKDSIITFGNQATMVPASTVKYSATIMNWPFFAYTNKLRITVESIASSNKNKDENCIEITTRTDNSQNLLWLKINANGAVLYEEFAETAQVDGQNKTVQFSYNETSTYVEIIIPHFWNQVVFDPNYQVLVDPSNTKPGCSHGFSTAKIAGIVVGCVIGVAIIAMIVGCFIFKTRRSRFLKNFKKKETESSNSSAADVPMVSNT